MVPKARFGTPRGGPYCPLKAEQAISALSKLTEEYSSEQVQPLEQDMEDLDAALENDEDEPDEEDKALTEVVPPLPFFGTGSRSCCD